MAAGRPRCGDLPERSSAGGLNLANGGRDGIGERIHTGPVMGVCDGAGFGQARITENCAASLGGGESPILDRAVLLAQSNAPAALSTNISPSRMLAGEHRVAGVAGLCPDLERGNPTLRCTRRETGP